MSLFPKYNTAAKPAKPAKPSTTLATLATLAGDQSEESDRTLATLAPRQKENAGPIHSNDQVPVSPLPECQQSLCEAHGDFNRWRGCCLVDLDQCLITKVIESGGDLDQLRGIDLGHGITTDMVIDEWLRSNEPPEVLISKPAWFICMAEHLSKGEDHGRSATA